MIKHAKPLARSARGFTLIELMVALVLGLLMIGAVTIVFISNQQTARTKQEMDRAQEAFRFASHTIMRVVQQGVIQEPQPNSSTERFLLEVRMNPAPEHRDCLGRPVLADPNLRHVEISLILDGDALRCRVVRVPLSGTPPLPPPAETLVTGLDPDRTEFRFGVGNQISGFWSSNEQWVSSDHATLEDNWHNVRSVRVRMAMQTEEGGDTKAIGPLAVFSATMRCGGLDNC